MSVKFSIYSLDNFSFIFAQDAPLFERLQNLTILFIDSPKYENWMSSYVKAIIDGIGTKTLFEYFNRWFYQRTQSFCFKLVHLICDELLSLDQVKAGLEPHFYPLFENELPNASAILLSNLDSCGHLVKAECATQFAQRLFGMFQRKESNFFSPVKIGDNIFNIIMHDKFNGEITNGRNFRIHFKSAYCDSTYSWKLIYFCEAECYSTSSNSDFIHLLVHSLHIF